MRQGHVSFSIIVSYDDLVKRARRGAGKMCKSAGRCAICRRELLDPSDLHNTSPKWRVEENDKEEQKCPNIFVLLHDTGHIARRQLHIFFCQSLDY